jgi:hypothetical protein
MQSHNIKLKLAVVLGEKIIQSCSQPSTKYKISAHNSENVQTF